MKKIKICKICEQSFVPCAGSKGIYCSKSCYNKDKSHIAKAYSNKIRQQLQDCHFLNPTLCHYCNKALSFDKKSNKFCSRSCSAISSNAKRRYNKNLGSNDIKFVLKKLNKLPSKGNHDSKRLIGNCLTCGIQFQFYKSDARKFCSRLCTKAGGYRPGSGKSKTGYYKGFYCGSSWELAFLIWHLDNNIPIKRCTSKFIYKWQNKNYFYYPDFEISDKIYEIKGKICEVDYVKIASCNAILVHGSHIKYYIEYVSKKYNVAKNKLWLLYDEKKEKNCLCCNKLFQPKTDKNIYCSRSCAMKANRKLAKKFAKYYF